MEVNQHLAEQASLMHERICALLEEARQAEHADGARIARLERLARQARDRWRRINGYPPLAYVKHARRH